jgi:hypothetical protein
MIKTYLRLLAKIEDGFNVHLRVCRLHSAEILLHAPCTFNGVPVKADPLCVRLLTGPYPEGRGVLNLVMSRGGAAGLRVGDVYEFVRAIM